MSNHIKRFWGGFRNCERGSSIVELAIIFPILLLLFIGIAELGRLFYTYTTLAKATKVGARYLSVSRDIKSSDPDIVAGAKLRAQNLVVCGFTDCTDKTPVVTGLSAASNVKVTLPVAGATVQYVKVEIEGYTFSPGVFNLESMAGGESQSIYFSLTPGTEMRYMTD